MCVPISSKINSVLNIKQINWKFRFVFLIGFMKLGSSTEKRIHRHFDKIKNIF